MRPAPLAAGLAALAVGLVSIAIAVAARAAWWPARLDWPGATYLIEGRSTRQAVLYDLRRAGRREPELTVGGSTDLLCDPPRLLFFDRDGDRRRDLLVLHCGGCDLVSWQPVPGALVERALPDHDCWGPGWWPAAVRGRGLRWLGRGLLFLVAGVVLLARAGRAAPAVPPARLIRR